jgi:hypothetical protein
MLPGDADALVSGFIDRVTDNIDQRELFTALSVSGWRRLA